MSIKFTFNKFRPGQILMAKRVLYAETDITKIKNNTSNAVFTEWNQIVEIGIPKYAMMYVVNIINPDIPGTPVEVQTIFDNKAVAFKIGTKEEFEEKFMIVSLPDISHLDVVDRWCTHHMGLNGRTVHGQVFFARRPHGNWSAHEEAIVGRFEDIKWTFGRYNFTKKELKMGESFIGICVRRKSATRSFIFEFMDEQGQHYCKQFRMSKLRRYKGQSLLDYFSQLNTTNRIKTYW